MILRLRTNIKRFVKKVYRSLIGLHSQYGEDFILKRLIEEIDIKNPGTYIDIGAHHPKKFSNTYFLYQKGWSGINIEPDPNLFALFPMERKRDINLNVGVGSEFKKIPFYMFKASTLSTFSSEQSTKYKDEGHVLIKIDNVQVVTLNEIFDKYLVGEMINLMSIDIEGYEIDALSGNDWKKYRPNIIVCEIVNNESVVDNFIIDRGYLRYYNNGTNSIYYDQKFKNLHLQKFKKKWFL